jgi:hypothetical protein
MTSEAMFVTIIVAYLEKGALSQCTEKRLQKFKKSGIMLYMLLNPSPAPRKEKPLWSG